MSQCTYATRKKNKRMSHTSVLSLLSLACTQHARILGFALRTSAQYQSKSRRARQYVRGCRSAHTSIPCIPSRLHDHNGPCSPPVTPNGFVRALALTADAVSKHPRHSLITFRPQPGLPDLPECGDSRVKDSSLSTREPHKEHLLRARRSLWSRSQYVTDILVIRTRRPGQPDRQWHRYSHTQPQT